MPGAPTLIAGLDVTPVTGRLLAAAAAAAAAAPGSPAAAAAARCAGLSPAAAVCEKKAACAAGWFSAMKGFSGPPVGPAEAGPPPAAGPWWPKPLPNGDFSNLGSEMRTGWETHQNGPATKKKGICIFWFKILFLYQNTQIQPFWLSTV